MENLKSIREAKGVKLSAVADYLGVSRQTYSKYEENQGAMSIDQAVAVCEFLGVSVNEIFFANKVK